MPIHDRYRHFAELLASEREGRDFTRRACQRGSAVAIIAPHGGGIEPGTSELALAIAGEELSYYVFDGLKPEGDTSLHLTSYRFDDPLCLEIASHARSVVTLHGCTGETQQVHVGGLDDALKQALIAALRGAGFQAGEDNSHHAGRHHHNLCNRGRLRMGAQLELEEGLRRALFQGLSRPQRQQTTARFETFVAALRSVLLDGYDGGAL